MKRCALKRFMYTPKGTFGAWYVDRKFICLTVEKPWRNNELSISCIPEGLYDLGSRESSVVTRTSKEQYRVGWEICDVPGGRTYIMVHIANYARSLAGCVGVGEKLTVIGDSFAVSNSIKAFDTFMNTMDINEGHVLSITFDKEVGYEVPFVGR